MGNWVMPSCSKILTKARNSPQNVTFTEICKLALCEGWVAHPENGSSHAVFTHPKLGNVPGSLMNFQNKKGKAKPYQVKQLLDALDLIEAMGKNEK